MMELDLSLGGLVGAIGGTIVAAVVYVEVISAINERALKDRAFANADERRALAGRLSLMRRTFLGIDLLAFSAGGYWLGHTFIG